MRTSRGAADLPSLNGAVRGADEPRELLLVQEQHAARSDEEVRQRARHGGGVLRAVGGDAAIQPP
jgi:hypothetical protein